MPSATSRDPRRRPLRVTALLCLSACAYEAETPERGATCLSLSTTQPIADDHGIPELGFSARDVLAWAKRTESQSVAWNDQVSIVVDPSVHADTLELRLERGDGPALIVRNDCAEKGTSFPPRLQIPARIVLALDNGRTLNLPATISTRRQGVAVVESAANASALAQLPMQARTPFEILSRRLRITIDAQGSAGRLDVSVERGEGLFIASGPTLNIMSWPAENPCGRDAIAHQFSDSEPEWLRLATHASELRWAGFDSAGTRTHDVSIEVPARTCHDESGPLTLPATLRLAQSGADPVVLEGGFHEQKGSAEFALANGGPWRGSVDEFATRFRPLSSGVKDFDQVELAVELKVSAQSAQGRVSVTGSRDCKLHCTATNCTECPPASLTRVGEIVLAPEREP